ncbi:hypothetical protein WA026_015029 [Henosepilachna vigintioctopunctata]|uniref:SAP30-binding protein n=1 Tax=Henosepilachna vigintioctopunctata TaxID=420089 RepID=A0AAW1TYX7_9CUCU
MSNSTALPSLTATYTDSEGEEDTNDEETYLSNSNTENTQSPTNYFSKSAISAPPSPLTAPIKVTTKEAKLVSNHNVTVASDDENEIEVNIPPHEVILITDENPNQEEEVTEDDGVSIPPEPPGHFSVDLQDKIAKYYDRMKIDQLDMNAFMEKRKDFRNPSIYEKLLQFCTINELGTNYPPSVYDPLT